MSLNGFGSKDSSQNVGGGDISSAETGGDRHGMSQSDANDFRAAAINAGAGQRVNPGFFDSKNVISPAEVAMAKAARNNPNNRFGKAAFNKTRGGFFGNFISGGGITGAIIKGLGQKFGLGKKYNEPTYNMSDDLNYNYTGEFEDDDEGTIYGEDVLTKDTNKNNGDGNRDGADQQGIYTIYPQVANAPESPQELLDFIQRFRVKEPYSQIKGSDYVQEAKDIVETMKNFYT
jgi:hypothetical protein